MSDLPYLEEPDPAEESMAEEAAALLAVSPAAGDEFAPAVWHLLGRHAYYSLGAASSALDALPHTERRRLAMPFGARWSTASESQTRPAADPQGEGAVRRDAECAQPSVSPSDRIASSS